MTNAEQPIRADQFSTILPQRGRPWLLPYNRKLRHLQGISIRNLTLAQGPKRSRGKTIDDEAIPSTLKTPTKVLAQRETKKLEHSRSSNDLRSGDEPAQHAKGEAEEVGALPSPSRPSITRMRRRSTMEWSGASPLERQQKLEDVTSRCMADTFYSLHVEGQRDPIYISEVVEKAMNPSFRFFDLGPCGPAVTRLDRLTVKVWAKTEAMANNQYLMEFTASLRSLQFVGKTLESFHHPLPQNCILFHMADGIYTSFTDLPSQSAIDFPTLPAKATSGRVLPTSTYDALMRLATLDDCIQDAILTREQIATEIKEILDANKEAVSIVAQVPEAEERVKTIQSAVSTQRKRLEAASRKKVELQANIKARREAIQKGREAQARAEDDMTASKEMMGQRKPMMCQTAEEITGQRRRICEDLQTIYPIEPIPNKPLAFTIRGLYLPNSEFEDAKEDVTAAALGHVAHVVHLLSFYLSVALPYPVQLRSSTSTIHDPISMTAGPRTYPLSMKGTVRYRFEYGVFLLNKDIEILANHLGLKLPDIRQTLPNLKYLLYVATAGKGELPARKAGGIRALLRHGGNAPLSRRASQDSTADSVSEPKGRVDGKDGALLSITNGSKDGGGKSNGKLSIPQKTTPLQSSNLREVM